MHKGDELFAIFDEAVPEVSLRAPWGRVSARRITAAEPFVLSRQRTGAAQERCAAPPQLEPALAHVLQIRVRHQDDQVILVDCGLLDLLDVRCASR